MLLIGSLSLLSLGLNCLTTLSNQENVPQIHPQPNMAGTTFTTKVSSSQMTLDFVKLT